MATSATVTALSGKVIVIDLAGVPRLLAVGDTVQAGDTVRPAPGASVQLQPDVGSPLTLSDSQAWLVGAEAPVAAQPALTEAINAVLDVLERGGDLDELEAAAAGVGGGVGGDGSSFVRLLRITEGVTPLAYEYGVEQPGRIDTVEGGNVIGAEAVPVPGDPPVEPPPPPPPPTDAFPYALDDSAKVVIRAFTEDGDLDARWKIAGKGNLLDHLAKPQNADVWMVSDASFKDGLATLAQGSFTVEDSGSGQPNETAFVVTPTFEAEGGDTFSFRATPQLGEGDTFQAVVYQQAGDGWNEGSALVPDADGVYTHTFDDDGTYRVGFVVDDQTGGSDSASAEIELLSPGYFSAPANTDYVYQSATGSLFANDQPGDGDHTFSFAGGTYDEDAGLHTIEGEHGTLVVDDDGHYVYTPDGEGLGHAAFDYTVTDADGDTSSATLRVGYEFDDFNLAHVDEGGHTIDLSDMLDVDSTDATALSAYLDFDENADGHSVITVDANGDGVPDGLQTSITLNDISLLDLQAYAGGSSEVDIIQKLLDNGNLRKDA